MSKQGLARGSTASCHIGMAGANWSNWKTGLVLTSQRAGAEGAGRACWEVQRDGRLGGRHFIAGITGSLALTGPRCQGEQKRILILPIVDLGSAQNILTP